MSRNMSHISVLSNRAFRRFTFWLLITNIGYRAEEGAIIWLVFQEQGHPAALVGTAQMTLLPRIPSLWWGGRLADRYSRRKIMLRAQAGMASLSLALIGAIRVPWPAGLLLIWGIMILIGLLIGINDPSQEAIVAELVRKEELHTARATYNACSHAAKIGGYLIPALLSGVGGTTKILLLDIATYIGFIGYLFRQSAGRTVPRREDVKSGEPERAVTQREAIQYIRRSPAILLALVTIAVIDLLLASRPVMRILLGAELEGAMAYALLAAANFTGSLFCVIFIITLNSSPTVRRMLASAMFFSAFILLQGLAARHSSLVWAMVNLVVAGFAAEFLVNAVATMRQKNVPNALMGRVSSIALNISITCTAAAIVRDGLLLDPMLGASGATMTIGGACLVASAIIWLVARHKRLLEPATTFPRWAAHIIAGIIWFATGESVDQSSPAVSVYR